MKGRKFNKAHKAKAKLVAPPFGGKETAAEEKAEHEAAPSVSGFKARMRLDRPGRKRGGRVGADMSPLTSAGRRCD